MTRRFGFPLAAAAASIAILPFSSPLLAAELPPIKASDDNKVVECATPGRLMVYLKSRNDKLDAKYEVLATEYMRHGEALGLRWDYAFFQMLLETGYLKYTGDVKPEQNNFAGLGATGGGARGESFKDVSTGARAHLEHLLMYSGQKVENPTAQRTRNVQDWGVLTAWQQGIKGPITFTQLAKQWAPGTKGYASDIQTIAQRFLDGPCKGEDPQPELVAEARGQTATVQTAANQQPEALVAPAVTDKGSDLARRAVDAARADGTPNRAGLGATALATAGDVGATAPPAAKVTATAAPAAPAAPATEATAAPTVKIINPAAASATTEKAATDSAPAKNAPAKTETAAKTASVKTETPAKTPTAKEEAPAKAIETASVAGAAKDAAKVEKKAAAKCRVWTASYGGAKAIIIKAVADQTTNYTVLDVNEGAEKREADAYISAYAKGGESVGEFATQTQALDKAFELCPEG
jgi:hypothetical protein